MGMNIQPVPVVIADSLLNTLGDHTDRSSIKKLSCFTYIPIPALNSARRCQTDVNKHRITCVTNFKFND